MISSVFLLLCSPTALTLLVEIRICVVNRQSTEALMKCYLVPKTAWIYFKELCMGT